MLKKYKYLTFLFAILFLFSSGTVLALEITYPDIGFTVTGDSSIADYVSYIITFIILSITGIGAITIAYSGFKILLNFGKPETISQARSKIVDTVIGITLLASSYLILSTINPELVAPSSGSIANLPAGVYFAESVPVDSRHPEGKNYTSALQSVEDTREVSLLSSSSDVKLYNKCKAGETKTIRVWLYTDVGYRRLSGDIADASKTIDVPCNSELSDSITSSGGNLSFFWRPKDTGVYFYRDASCQGLAVCDSDNPNCSQKNSNWIQLFDDIPDLSSAETQTIKSVQIVNGSQGSDEQWGVVLSRTDNGTGECSDPLLTLDETQKILNKGEERCFPIPQITDEAGAPEDLNPQFAYIFHPSPQDLGTGVYLQSNNLELLLPPSLSGQTDPSGYIGAQWKHEAICDPASAYYNDCLDADFNPNLNEIFIDPDLGTLKENVAVYTNTTSTAVLNTLECQYDDPFSPCLENIYSEGSHYNIVLYARPNIRYYVDGGNRVGSRCMVANGVVEELKASGNYDEFIGAEPDPGVGDLFYTSTHDLYKIYIIPSSVSDR